MHRRPMLPLLAFLMLLATGLSLAVLPPPTLAPVREYVHSLQIGRPSRYRNLAIYPLLGTQNWHANVMSMDEAVRSHQLIIGEIGEGEVNDLAVENTGKLPVFIMAGEILEGAKQTRVLQTDVLVPPHSGRLHISAFCVEHGRWSYQSDDRQFKTGGLVSNPAVRAKAQIAKDQSSVWNEVDATHRRLQVPATTGALTEAYRAPRIQQDISPYVQALEGLPQESPHMSGAIVMVDRHILCADSFGPRPLLLDLWPKLIRSYALEAVADVSRGDEDTDDLSLAQAFLQRTDSAAIDKASTAGIGLLEEIEGPAISGTALLHEGWPLHLSLFPRSNASRSDKGENDVTPIERNYHR